MNLKQSSDGKRFMIELDNLNISINTDDCDNYAVAKEIQRLLLILKYNWDKPPYRNIKAEVSCDDDEDRYQDGCRLLNELAVQGELYEP